MSCIEEEQTQHHRGRFFGFGRIRDAEDLLFAVFDKTPRNGNRLKNESFPGRDLVGSNLSIARLKFLTKPRFNRGVVKKNRPTKGALVGWAKVNAHDVRQIETDLTFPSGKQLFKAVCAIDKVEKGDISAHGTLGYSERFSAANGVSEGQLGTARSRIRLELARQFSSIESVDTLALPSWLFVFRCRIRSIRRQFRRG